MVFDKNQTVYEKIILFMTKVNFAFVIELFVIYCILGCEILLKERY